MGDRRCMWRIGGGVLVIVGHELKSSYSLEGEFGMMFVKGLRPRSG